MTEPTTIRVIDMHTAGEPVRIVEAGYPALKGSTILEKRRDARRYHDHLRRAIMLEPRGHSGMYGVIPTAASRNDADFAVLFMHQEGYSTMCGHATIALGRWAVDTGRTALNEGRAGFRLETPCGVLDVAVRQDADGTTVSFLSVEAFASLLDQSVEVPGFGQVRLDVAFGGAFYAILPADRIGLSLMDTPLPELVAAAVAITDAVRASITIEHPTEPDLGFLYGTILTDSLPLGNAGARTSYNLCIFGNGQIDRSPTGSGLTARIALAAAKGEMVEGQSCLVAGISGQSFAGTLAATAAAQTGVVSRVRVEGTAFYTGNNELICEPADPFASGLELPSTFSGLFGP